MNDIALSQRDPRWANRDLGETLGGKTIGEAGCLLTCLAIILRKVYGTDVIPPTLNNALARASTPFVDDDTLVWDKLWPLFYKFISSYRQDGSFSISGLSDLMRRGEVVLRYGNSVHFVYLESIDDGVPTIIDPYTGKRCSDIGVPTGVRVLNTVHIQQPTMVGLHDRSGGDWMVCNGVKGACTIPLYVKHIMDDINPNYNLGLSYMITADVHPIISCRYHYATDDGGAGTSPPASMVSKFENVIIKLMEANPGCSFVYLNEMNNPREHSCEDVLTPSWYVESYNRLWSRKPELVYLSPGAIDPYNAESDAWHDWRVTWRWCLDNIKGADFLAFHAYTHGPGPIIEQITSTQEFGDPPLLGVYYDMMVLKSQQDIVPARFVDLPQYVTEFNHFRKRDGMLGWDRYAGEYMIKCYEFFSKQGIVYATAFRYNFNQWRLDDKSSVLDAIISYDKVIRGLS